jgi:hypothetical protein
MRLDSLVRDLGGANPYELLGLKVTATGTEIKEARRRLQRQAHPDLVDGDEDFARVINIAADLLLDPQRRAMFDSGAEVTSDRLYGGDPGPGKVQMPPPDEPAPPSWATESSFWDLRPARPRTINAAMWSMYLAAISCALFFVIGAVGTGVASDASARLGEVTDALALAAVPIAIWIAITVTLGTGIRQGWRGISGAGWALTIIVLLPIGLSCGTLMSYTLTPAAASTTDKEIMQRVPDLIEGTMIWAFPLGLVFALAAMVLISLRVSRNYLETMAAVRETADQVTRRHVGRRRR